jgi:hypothetical protein
MREFKIGDMVRIKNRDAIILNTMKYVSEAQVVQQLEDGEYDCYFKYCGTKTKIKSIINDRRIRLECSSMEWFVEDLESFSDGQLEFDFDKK